MRIVTFNAPIMVSQLRGHNEIKEQIVSTLDKMGRYSFVTEGGKERITHTDWHLGDQSKKPYLDIIEPHIVDHIADIKKLFGFTIHEITRSWFQWYERNDYHSVHCHQRCMFSSVYYVQLAKTSTATCFVLNGQEFYVDVSEGDVITFPSFVSHQSKPNQSDEPKIVIAFNSDFF